LKPGEVTAGKIAFQLAPRLNAGGRGGDRRARFAGASDGRNGGEGRTAGKHSGRKNQERKRLEREILEGAEASSRFGNLTLRSRRVIALAGEGWNAGVMGLAASRLVEKYNLPRC
jgi:single-stranded-DNA-specific exonuclease